MAEGDGVMSLGPLDILSGGREFKKTRVVSEESSESSGESVKLSGKSRSTAFNCGI